MDRGRNLSGAGGELERLLTAVPGPRTAALIPRLRAHESRNVTFFADGFPIFWESAEGANVVDVDGNRYIDLTAAFGVANTGHSHPSVVSAIAEQAARLMHGMGDVFPNEPRVRLLERLSQRVPAGLTTTFLATTGSEAVEAALKTAMLATGKSRFASYRNGYHGLSLGTLPLCGFERFRAPFAAAAGRPAVELEYPGAGTTASAALAATRRALAPHSDIAALVIEPVQGRGGCIAPPPGYLAAVRALCDELGIVLIADEIFTGFGRTGSWFAVEHEGVVPDVLCLGKALASGFPLAAAVGRREIMEAWPPSTGEALHTSTYLGNPMGCAAALATLDVLERHELPARAARLGLVLAPRLEALRSLPAVAAVRGRGLLWGIEMRDSAAAQTAARRALATGAIVLQSGPAGETISLSPPLVIAERQLERAIELLTNAIASLE